MSKIAEATTSARGSMFFPQHGAKVSLGGKSSQGVSREEVLKRTKQEREKRQRRKTESQAATRLQVNTHIHKHTLNFCLSGASSSHHGVASSGVCVTDHTSTYAGTLAGS